jgi:hypothetical protein
MGGVTAPESGRTQTRWTGDGGLEATATPEKKKNPHTIRDEKKKENERSIGKTFTVESSVEVRGPFPMDQVYHGDGKVKRAEGNSIFEWWRRDIKSEPFSIFRQDPLAGRGKGSQKGRDFRSGGFGGGLQGRHNGFRGLFIGKCGLGVSEWIPGCLEEVEEKTQCHAVCENEIGCAQIRASATGGIIASGEVEPPVAVRIELFPSLGFLKAPDDHVDGLDGIDGEVDLRPAPFLFQKGPDSVFRMGFLDFFEKGFRGFGRKGDGRLCLGLPGTCGSDRTSPQWKDQNKEQACQKTGKAGYVPF